MKSREVKDQIIEDLTQKLNEYNHLFFTDISGLDAEQTGELRKKCYDNSIRLEVVKNTLLKKAFAQSEQKELLDDLEGTFVNNTTIMFCETGNVPAKIIQEFRKKYERPLLKAAYVEESLYFGDEEVETIANLKSKDELIGDLVLQLKEPMNKVLSSLKSGSDNITGILKTLSEKQ